MVSIVNKKARFDYEIVEKLEAGIALVGSEVKSVRAGHVNLGDAFCFVEGDEIYLKNCRISAYDKATILPPDELRSRKLLLHRREINRLIGKSREKSLTIVPLSMYFKGRRVKGGRALARGKRNYGKKETIKGREIGRDKQRQKTDATRRNR